MGDPTYTIADVARVAGVSVSTVSRILNGKQDVAQSTRERVQQVIEELGFAPHAQAQRLRAGKTNNIALLFPLKYPGNLPYNALEMDFIIGASSAAAERNYLLHLVTTQATEQALLNFYRSNQVDGLILMHIHTQDWRVDLLRQNDLPFVMIGHCADNTGLSFVDLDFEAVLLAAVQHIVELGHQRIGFLSLPVEMRHQGFGPAVRAWDGYQRALRTYAIPALYREVSYVGQDIFDATLSMLDEDPELTAIVTTHEFASQSIIQALRTRGREVPQDVSLIALMTERIAELNIPPVTHIDFPAYEMGHRAFNILIDILEDQQDQPDQILIAPRLMIHNSTLPV